jgi:CRP-like cAMP-binding protein
MSLESDVDVLRRIAFFERFADEHLKLIAFSAESRSLPDKLLLYDDGQLLHSAYVVVTGTLRGERRERGKTIAARAIGPGMILGERALILDTRATESVRVESRARVLQIRKVTFRRLLQEYPAIAVTLRARLSRSVLASAAELAAAMQRLSTLG